MPAIKYQRSPTSDKTWNGAQNEKNLKTGQAANYYDKMYAWVDPDKDDTTKAAYKFPHHEVDDKGGIGAANIKACQSIISVLNGGMGGTDIPDKDKQGVYDHAAQHLKDADVTPADLKKRSKHLKGDAEMRSFSMPDLTADDEGHTVEGHAAVFGQTTVIDGMWKETIARGAFDNTDFTDVLFDANHDLMSIPLARSRNNNANSSLQLQVDDKGLNTRANLDIDNNADAKALYSAIKRGDINGMSFIFSVSDDEWTGLDDDNAMPSRTIKAIGKVYEVSAVSMPAYAGTDINARSEEALESAKRVLENARARGLESSADDSDEQEERQQEDLDFEKLKYKMLGDLKFENSRKDD